MAQSLDFTRLGVAQALLHLETGITHLNDATLADDGVMELHGLAEVQVHMNENVFEGEPVDFSLKDMLKVPASTHVEVIALRPVIDMVVRVEVAHAYLNRTRVHRLLISSQSEGWAAT